MVCARLPYVFMVLEDHPYGREMLRSLLAAGLVPLAVIEERSAIAEQEAAKFNERMAGLELAPSFDELLAGLDQANQDDPVERLLVPNHNLDTCATLLRTRSPELLVLGGTRILRERIFGLAKHTLNAHPGLLPEVRGSASVAWAIETDVQIGCTCHFIDAGVDTGEIVSRELIPVHRSDSYERLCWKTTRLSATLMAAAVRAYFDGSIRSTPQPPGGATYRNMPDQDLARVKHKLADGRYAHFAD